MRFHDCYNPRNVKKQTKVRENTPIRMRALKHGAGVFARLEHRFGCIEHGQNLPLSLQLVVPSLVPLPSVDMRPLHSSPQPSVPSLVGSVVEEASSQSLASLVRWIGIVIGSTMTVVVQRRKMNWFVEPW